MNLEMRNHAAGTAPGPGGLTGWLLGRALDRFRRSGHKPARLALIERIALAPRQSLALVEAEGRRVLVATSADGPPVFYPLDSRTAPTRSASAPRRPTAARASW